MKTASQIFQAAIERESATLQSLDTHDLLERLVEIADAPEGGDRLLVEYLSDRAAEGSVPAVAALIMLHHGRRNDRRLHERAFEALKACAHRSADVIQALAVDGLTVLAEEENARRKQKGRGGMRRGRARP